MQGLFENTQKNTLDIKFPFLNTQKLLCNYWPEFRILTMTFIFSLMLIEYFQDVPHAGINVLKVWIMMLLLHLAHAGVPGRGVAHASLQT